VVAEHPASPPARRLRQPSWLDLRLITGVLLVLVSVLLGAKVVAAADRSVQVWALTHDVSAGTILAVADLRPARVRLFDSAAAYLRVPQSPAGRTVTRTLHAGELLPRSAVIVTPPGAIVSIPVQLGNAPGLARGELIDVWSTAKGCAPVQVLSRVPVQEIHEGGGGGLSVDAASTQVIVRVAPAEARRVVTALGSESTIRLVVLDGDLPLSAAPKTAVDRCVPISAAGSPYRSSPTAEPAAPSRPAAQPNAPGPPASTDAPTPSPSPPPSSTPTSRRR
jgi:hypothetical protein